METNNKTRDLYYVKEKYDSHVINDMIKGILNIVIPKVIGYKTAKDDNRIFEFLPYNMIQLIHQECGLYDPEKNEEFIYSLFYFIKVNLLFRVL